MDAAGPALQDAIRHLHGLEATWLESVPVHEQHDGKTVWQGEVRGGASVPFAPGA